VSADLPPGDEQPEAAPTAAATILLVDDHPVLRHGLAALLLGEDWVARVVEAGGVAEGARLAILERPELAVVDLGLPDGSGVGLIAQLRQSVPGCAIAVLTMTAEPSAVAASLDAGARGYLRKDTPPRTLVHALRSVAEGGTVLGPGIAAQALDRGAAGEPRAPLNRLSPRDLAVVRMLADGRGNAEIARQLHVSEKTVRNRLSTIYTVIGVADRVQAALLAREKGLADGPAR
jgi:DNA-binding NarL/FixJ family response regulator